MVIVKMNFFKLGSFTITRILGIPLFSRRMADQISFNARKLLVSLTGYSVNKTILINLTRSNLRLILQSSTNKLSGLIFPIIVGLIISILWI